jgi:arrestin-2
MANKVFKKSSADGKIVLYLEKRTLYDSTKTCDPINGLIVVNDDSVKDQQVFVQLVVTYQYGRGDCDEMLGVKFAREFLLCHQVVRSVKQEKFQVSTLQKRLMTKLGDKARPFQLTFPVNSPNSVVLRDLDRDDGKELGVSYAVQAYVSDDVDDDPKDSETFIDMTVIKLQHASAITVTRLPMAWISKGMAFGQGKIDLEVTLDREYFYHGEQVPVSIVIINDSSKTVQYVKCVVVQHTEVTMIDTKIDKQVASLETRDGFPIESGDCMTKYLYLVPTMDNNSDRFGKEITWKECGLYYNTFDSI